MGLMDKIEKVIHTINNIIAYNPNTDPDQIRQDKLELLSLEHRLEVISNSANEKISFLRNGHLEHTDEYKETLDLLKRIAVEEAALLGVRNRLEKYQ